MTMSRSIASAAISVIVGLTSAACVMPTSNKVIATSGVPSVAGAQSQPHAALGATIEVSDSTGSKKAAYTVADFQSTVPKQYTQVNGTLYTINVTVQGVSGTVTVSPTYFSASTKDGTHLDPKLAAVDNELTVSQLPQGQHMTGQIGFDVPTGQAIAQILLQGPLGDTQAVWSVS